MHSNNDDIHEVRFWFWRALGYTCAAVAVLSVLSWILYANGLIFNTVLERKVFENSHQYSEARKSEVAEYEAALAEIDMQIADPDTDPSVKKNLKRQRAGIARRLDAAKDKAGQ